MYTQNNVCPSLEILPNFNQIWTTALPHGGTAMEGACKMWCELVFIIGRGSGVKGRKCTKCHFLEFEISAILSVFNQSTFNFFAALQIFFAIIL